MAKDGPGKPFELIMVAPHSDVDEFRHVSNVAYVRWIQDAARAHGTAIGWVPERYPRVGAVFIIRRHEIDYQRSAVGGDEIRIVTWVEEFRRASATRETRIYRTRDNALLVSATTEWVFVTYDDNYRPTRIPAEVADDFRGGPKGSVFHIDPAVPTGTPVMMIEGIPGGPGET